MFLTRRPGGTFGAFFVVVAPGSLPVVLRWLRCVSVVVVFVVGISRSRPVWGTTMPMLQRFPEATSCLRCARCASPKAAVALLNEKWPRHRGCILAQSSTSPKKGALTCTSLGCETMMPSMRASLGLAVVTQCLVTIPRGHREWPLTANGTPVGFVREPILALQMHNGKIIISNVAAGGNGDGRYAWPRRSNPGPPGGILPKTSSR